MSIAIRADPDDLQSAILDLYDAALTEEGASAAIRRMSDATGDCAIIVSVRETRRKLRIIGSVNIDPDCLPILERDFATAERNPILAAVETLPSRRLTAASSIIRREDYLRTKLYNDVFRPQSVAHIAAACLSRDEDHIVPMAVMERSGGGELDDRDLRRLSILTPHLGNAMALMLKLWRHRQRADTVEDLIDRLRMAVFVVSPDGVVLFENAAGEALLAGRHAMSLVDRRLHCADRRADQRLRRAVAEASAPGAPGFAGTPGLARGLPIERPDDLPLRAVVLPFHGGMLPGAAAAGAVVWISDPALDLTRSWALAAETFGLTRAEARVLGMLASGRTIAGIAETNEVSVWTVRSQVRALTRKMGRSSIVELVIDALNAPGAQLLAVPAAPSPDRS